MVNGDGVVCAFGGDPGSQAIVLGTSRVSGSGVACCVADGGGWRRLLQRYEMEAAVEIWFGFTLNSEKKNARNYLQYNFLYIVLVFAGGGLHR